MNKKGSIKISTLLFYGIIAFILSSFIMHIYLNNEKNNKISRATHLLESQISKLQYSVDSRLLNLTALEMLIKQKGGMIDNFHEVAQTLYKEDDVIRCIQLAENGVITIDTIYPVEGNETGVGNLFKNPIRREEAIYARDNKITTLAGPFILHQGGVGVVARRPIYINDESGEENFWGFSIQVMDFEKLLKAADIDVFDNVNYDYMLIKRLGNDENQHLSGVETISPNAINGRITVPGNVWELYIIPREGWISNQSLLTAIVLIVLSVLITVLLSWHRMKFDNLFEKYKQMSKTDVLTGLLNIGEFYDHMTALIDEKIPFSVFFLDLNKFKSINDSHGHVIGDKMLALTAKRILDIVPENGKAFRVGGDEFAICIAAQGLEFCENYKKRVIDETSFVFSEQGIVISVSTSCGYAMFPDDASTVRGVIQIADSRMYSEKYNNAGGNSTISNRERFISAIEKIIKDCKNDGSDDEFYLFHIDFANFKHINYHNGIEAGDNLIKKMMDYCNSLKACILCVRGFADHLYLLVKEPKEYSIEYITDLFDKRLNSFVELVRDSYPKTKISVWCGFSRIEGLDFFNAIGRANIGRSDAKYNNIHKPVFVDEEYVYSYMEKKDLEQRISIDCNEGRIKYNLQPQIDPESGEMISAEVLGRIYHKDGTIVYPDVFIPILEKNNAIVSFDLKILEKVCCDMRERIDANKKIVPISLNLSRLHINNENSISNIKEIISRYNIDPKYLCFEITESIILEKNTGLIEFCNALHELGVNISVDDFGVGYTNLAIIKDVAIDELKLDKYFIDGDHLDEARYISIIESIIDMAKKLNIRVVCEGVESVEQLEFIKKFNIDAIQGYYFSKPLEPKQIYDKYL